LNDSLTSGTPKKKKKLKKKKNNNNNNNWAMFVCSGNFLNTQFLFAQS
jgi:hypothetical protein